MPGPRGALLLLLAGACASSPTELLVHAHAPNGIALQSLVAQISVGATAKTATLSGADLAAPIRVFLPDSPAVVTVALTARDTSGTSLRAHGAVTSVPRTTTSLDLQLAAGGPLGWTQEASGTTATLRGVFGVGDDLYAVGDSGTILHGKTSQATWVPEPSGLNTEIDGISGEDGAGSRAAVSGCTILRSDAPGQPWTPSTITGCPGALLGVWVSRSNGVWVAGGNETIYHSATGKAPWNVVNDLGGQVHALWGNPLVVCDGVDGGGFKRSYDGVSGWSSVPEDVLGNNDIYGLWGTDELNVYIVGEGGTLARFDGDQVRCLQPGCSITSSRLRGVWAYQSDVFVVGENGTLLHSADKGLTFASEAGAGWPNLYAVWGNGRGDVYAVGEGGKIYHGR
jgi:hypothetical protein